jgi:hypothetical protein
MHRSIGVFRINIESRCLGRSWVVGQPDSRMRSAPQNTLPTITSLHGPIYSCSSRQSSRTLQTTDSSRARCNKPAHRAADTSDPILIFYNESMIRRQIGFFVCIPAGRRRRRSICCSCIYKRIRHSIRLTNINAMRVLAETRGSSRRPARCPSPKCLGFCRSNKPAQALIQDRHQPFKSLLDCNLIDHSSYHSGARII